MSIPIRFCRARLPAYTDIRAAASRRSWRVLAPDDIVRSHTRHTFHHCATMPDGPGYHNRQLVLATKIYSLLCSLSPLTYDEIAPKIEYWIEYVTTEQFTTTGDLVERLLPIAWDCDKSYYIARFLKEFRDAPCRSECMRSFVDDLSIQILRWFAIAAADNFSSSDFSPNDMYFSSSVYWKFITSGGSIGFPRAASFVGHLIECGLLNHDLVRRHLIKPLIAHHGYNIHRARAIYQLFVAAGKPLLRGLLEPGDVKVCFETLETEASRAGIGGFDAARLNVRRDSRSDAFHHNLTWARNFVRSMLRGCSAGRRSEGMSRKLNRKMGCPTKSPWKLERPLLLFLKISPPLRSISSLLPSCMTWSLSPGPSGFQPAHSPPPH